MSPNGIVMESFIDAEVLACFLDEAQDTLEKFERSCLDLEETGSREALESLFRAAHNLKGASRAVGLEGLGEYIHELEDIISATIRGRLPVTGPNIDTMLGAQADILQWLALVRQDPETPLPYSRARQRILSLRMDASANARDQAEKAQIATVSKPSSPSDHPAPAAGDPEDVAALFAQAKQQYRKKRDAERAQPSVETDTSLDQTVVPHEAAPDAPPEDVEALFKAARTKYKEGRLREQQQAPPPQGEPTPASTVAAPSPPQEAKRATKNVPNSRPVKTDETIRISASKLDELIQLVGELAIHAAIITESRRNDGLNTKACLHAIGLSAKITKDLHGKALSLRMQPVQGLFQRVERVIKDVARSQGKRVQVDVEGGDVELDKQVIEEIIDPLVHMVRNSVDHGLETPEVRKHSGKSEVGKIILQAVHDAAGVTVVLHDDGKGLNTARIREKAIERGLMSAATTLPTKQIWQMIFEPGFSTADQITEISGRGVGMDVVQKAVQGLGGSIDVDSVEGKGTKFMIALPTSVSVIDALVVKMGDMRYAIPMQELDEIIDLSHYAQSLSGDHTKVIEIRGNVVPVQSLKTYLNVKSQRELQGQEAQHFHVPAVISRTTMGTVAFEVDQVIAQQAVVVRPLSKQLEGLMGISGCTILGDGEPGMIVSLQEISRRFLQSLR